MKRMTTYPLLLAAIGAAALVLNGCGQQQTREAGDGGSETQPDSPVQGSATASAEEIPRLVDLGAHECVACKMMAPILIRLTTEYEGRMKVEFIDVWENPQAGKAYGIQRIPTQIFFAPDGKELFRHVGFYSRDEILAKRKELGYDLKPRAADGDRKDAAKAEPAPADEDAE